METYLTYFGSKNIILLLTGILLFITAFYFHEIRRNFKSGLVFLIISALILRLFAALLDPFFHPWDEQVHALVAKNMMKYPFKPMLYLNPILPYNIGDWTHNYIWVHKQPLFLWQIALSFKCFGISPFTLRLPSIIMSTLLIPLIYDIGKFLFNRNIAFYASVLACSHNYILKLVSGYLHTDHNDIAFLFYITLSFWTWIKYTKSDKFVWALLTGVFAGFAVLNKWLIGLLVYFGWFWFLVISKNFKNKKQILNLIFSFLICFVIFVPWQIYISINFPAESKWEYSYSYEHFINVVEKHGGGLWYHFNSIKILYSKIFQWLIPISIISLLIKIKTIELKNRYILLSLLIVIFWVYLFFSLAKTKMMSFPVIVSPFIFLFLGYFIYGIFVLIDKYIAYKLIKNSLKFFVISFLFFSLLYINDLRYYHTNIDGFQKNVRAEKLRNYNLGIALKKYLNDNDYIILNMPEFSHLATMILSENTAYDFLPQIDEINEIKVKNNKIVIFDDGKLSNELIEDTSLFKLKIDNINETGNFKFNIYK